MPQTRAAHTRSPNGLAAEPQPDDGQVHHLPLWAIRPSKLNPRSHSGGHDLGELAASIERQGVQQPIVVRPITDQADLTAKIHDGPHIAIQGAIGGPKAPQWEIVCGERRWRASGIARQETVPAVIRALDDGQALAIALLENLARRDMTPLEEARGYQRLRDAGWKVADIAHTVGKAPPTISNALAVLELPAEVLEYVERDKLSIAHAKALLRYRPFPQIATHLAAAAVQREWSSKVLESHTPPDVYELERLGLARRIRQWEEPWKSACPACPFGANADGYCLRPDHFAELEQQAHAAEQQRRAHMKPAAEAQEGDVLDPNTYTTLYGDAPPPCQAGECPCYRKVKAQNYRGETETRTICTDIPRNEELRRLYEQSREKQRKADRETTLQRLTERLDALTAIGPAELAVLASAVCGTGATNASSWNAALRRHAGAHFAAIKDDDLLNWQHRRERLPTLTKLDTLPLARLLLEALLRKEIHDSFGSYGGGKATLTQWYLEQAGPENPLGGPPAAAETAAVPAP